MEKARHFFSKMSEIYRIMKNAVFYLVFKRSTVACTCSKMEKYTAYATPKNRTLSFCTDLSVQKLCIYKNEFVCVCVCHRQILPIAISFASKAN